MLLYIDPDRVGAEIRYEDLYNCKEDYPHIYGPLEVEAVVEIEDSGGGRRKKEEGVKNGGRCLVTVRGARTAHHGVEGQLPAALSLPAPTPTRVIDTSPQTHHVECAVAPHKEIRVLD